MDTTEDTGVAEAIDRAFALPDLRLVEELSDRLWYRLPVDHAERLLRLVAGLTPAELERHPRLMLAAYQAHYFSAKGPDPTLRRFLRFYASQGRRYAATFTRFDEPADVHAAGMIALIGARLRGDLALSERIAEQLEDWLSRLSGVTPPWQTDGPNRPGWLSSQRALTALLDGRFHDAMTHARAGHEEMGPPPSLHFAGVNAAAYAALVAALAGGRTAALRWLAAVEEAPPVPAPIQELTFAPARLAETVLATDALDEVRASVFVGRLGDPTSGYEIWPFIAAALARFDLLFRTPSLGLARLDDTCDALGASAKLDRIAGGLLLRMRADLLLEAGEGNAVLAMATAHPGVELLRVPVARAHLRAGHLSHAIRISSGRLQFASAPRRDTLDHLLVLAGAQLCRGDDDDARSLFRTALDYYATTGNRSAFREMDADDLDRLCRLVGTENPLSDIPRATTVRHEVQLVRLTRREEVVLRALGTGDTLEMIARRLSVSTNTVRSQVRSIYRKLGVSTRADAVAVAARGGVLRAGR